MEEHSHPEHELPVSKHSLPPEVRVREARRAMQDLLEEWNVTIVSRLAVDYVGDSGSIVQTRTTAPQIVAL